MQTKVPETVHLPIGGSDVVALDHPGTAVLDGPMQRDGTELDSYSTPQ